MVRFLSVAQAGNAAESVSQTSCQLLASAGCYVQAVDAPSDMGGRTEFFGPIVREQDEPVFHQPWEGRVFGIAFFLLPLLGRNLDIGRFAMQKLPRDVYLSSYYRRWLGAFENLLVEAEYLAPGEVDARIAGRSAGTGRR